MCSADTPKEIVNRHISRNGNLRVCGDATALQNDITQYAVDYNDKKKYEAEFKPATVYEKYLAMEPLEFKNWLFNQILSNSKTNLS